MLWASEEDFTTTAPIEEAPKIKFEKAQPALAAAGFSSWLGLSARFAFIKVFARDGSPWGAFSKAGLREAILKVGLRRLRSWSETRCDSADFARFSVKKEQ